MVAIRRAPRHSEAATTTCPRFGIWVSELGVLSDESFTENETRPLDLRDCQRDPDRTRRFLYLDKIFPRRERSFCERRRTFQIRVAWRGGRSRYSLLSLAGFAARVSRPHARTGWLQIAWCGLRRGTCNSGRLFEKVGWIRADH